MRIRMDQLGDEAVLAGATSGRAARTELLNLTDHEPEQPEPVFLDFQKVEIATASFLRESVLAFRDDVRRRRSNFYPVVANAATVVTDELQVLVAPRGDVLMLCSLDDEDRPSEPRLLGMLEAKQRVTFDLVRQRGETDAAELMRDHGESEGVKQTAWNNRLSALADLGLVVEVSDGRSKRYRPLLMES